MAKILVELFQTPASLDDRDTVSRLIGRGLLGQEMGGFKLIRCRFQAALRLVKNFPVASGLIRDLTQIPSYRA